MSELRKPLMFQKPIVVVSSMFLILLMSIASVSAQWVGNGPYAKNIRSFSRPADNLNTIFAGSYGWGVFVSLDAGSTWKHYKSGLTNTFVRSIYARSSAVVVCGTNDNVARSADSGHTWTPVQTTAFSVRAVSYDPVTGHWYAATYGDDFYRSVDDGLTWTKQIVTDPVSGETMSHLRALERFGADSIYAGGSIADIGTGGALFASYDGGVSWTQIQKGIGVRSSVNSISISPTSPSNTFIFGTGLKGIYQSRNGGGTISDIDGTTSPSPLPDTVINATDLTAAYRLGETENTCGLYRRALNADSSLGWLAATGLPGSPYPPEAMTDVSGSTLFAGFDRKGIYRSLDSGKTFASSSAGLMGTSVRDIVITSTGRVVVCTGFGDRIFHSDNDGGSWTPDSVGSFSSIFRLTKSTTGVLYAAQYGTGVQKSVDQGLTWTLTDTIGINHFSRTVDADPFNANTVYQGTGNGVFKTTNSGTSWINMNGVGIPTGTSIHSMGISPVTANLIFAGTDSSFLFRSSDGGATWAHLTSSAGFVTTDMFIRSIGFDPVRANYVYAGSDSGRVYRSTNGGVVWSLLFRLSTINSVRGILVDPTNNIRILAATFGGGLFKTEDGGLTWTPLNDGLRSLDLWSIESRPGSSPTQFWVGSDSSGVFKYGIISGCCHQAGDADNNGVVNISDVVALIGYVFNSTPVPPCNDQADADGNNIINISDVVAVIGFVFNSTPLPVCGTTGH